MEINNKKALIFDIILFSILLVLSGLFSLYLGNGTDEFDCYNYHIYAPYAFLNDRYSVDYLPAGIRSYFNPTLDILSYILIRLFNNFPHIFVFIQGLQYGVLVFCGYKIASLFRMKSDFETICFRLTCVILIGVSQFMMHLCGTVYNDIYISIIVLIALYFYLKYLEAPNIKMIIISGILLGAVSGLKLSSLILVVSLFFVIMIFHIVKIIKQPLKYTGYLLVSYVGGFLIFNFYWYYKIWTTFKNPVFPFFNNIFNSLYGQNAEIFLDSYFFEVPHGVWNKLIYPFSSYVAKELYWFGSLGCKYTDIFIPVAYILVPCILLKLIFNIKKGLNYNQKIVLFLSLWIVPVYLLWVNFFCIVRFIIPVLISAVILIVYVLYYLGGFIKINTKIKTVLLSLMLIIFNLQFSEGNPTLFHKPIGKKIIEFPDAHIEDNSVVILASQMTSYVVPFLNPKANYVLLIFPISVDTTLGVFHYRLNRTVDYYYSEYYENVNRKFLNLEKVNKYIIIDNIYGIAEKKLYIEALEEYTSKKVELELIDKTKTSAIYKIILN